MSVMKIFNAALTASLTLAGLQSGFAQNSSAPPTVAGSPIAQTGARARREQAYGKLLEAQRYIWKLSNRARGRTNSANEVRLAKEALQKAVELDPNLAEAWTARADLIFLAPADGFDEAILFANVAVKIDPNNFGARRILARSYTLKSRRDDGTFDAGYMRQAIEQWKEVARLDPRNAEAFAFLSEFYAQDKKTAERLDALRRWLAAAASLDARFYRAVLGGRADLSPESATLKFGQALLETGETREATEVLSRAVADNPESEEAIELLRQAVNAADATAAATTAQALQQAVYANPENAKLAEMLAQVQARVGKIDDAAKVLRDSAAKLTIKNKFAAADLLVTLGDIYEKAKRADDAVAAYQNALTTRGIGAENLVSIDGRDFAIRVFGKIIDVYQKSNRSNDAKVVIERARAILGSADTFADKRLVSLYLETGKRAEALQAVRALRAKTPADRELTRLEARILTENGKVDEAVALLKAPSNLNSVGVGAGSGNGDGTFSIGNPVSAEIGNYIYISELYTLAKRPKEAVQSVNQALAIAKTKYEKEVVKLTLATLQQSNGDFNAAEITLRGMLKETPDNSIALNNLGYFLAERGEKLEEALQLIQKALELDPNNSSYLDSLGWAYFKLGKLPEAEKNLKAALQIDDTSSTVQEHLGDVYQKQGKSDLAKTAWQKALTLTADADEVRRLKTKLNVK